MVPKERARCLQLRLKKKKKKVVVFQYLINLHARVATRCGFHTLRRSYYVMHADLNDQQRTHDNQRRLRSSKRTEVEGGNATKKNSMREQTQYIAQKTEMSHTEEVCTVDTSVVSCCQKSCVHVFEKFVCFTPLQTLLAPRSTLHIFDCTVVHLEISRFCCRSGSRSKMDIYLSLNLANKRFL